MSDSVFTDEYVSDLIENHVFKGTTASFTTVSGKIWPAQDWEDSGWDAWIEYGQGKTILVEGLGQVNIIKTFGGEGQGDEQSIVFFVDTGDWEQYYRVDGYYSSYGESYYEGPLFKVSPVVREVTFWE